MGAVECVARGRLGADPKFGEGEKAPWVVFSIACQSNKAYPPTWMNVVAYKGQRDVVEKLKLHKGDYVSIVGPLMPERKDKGSECKHPHNRLKLSQIFLIIRSRSSEEKHYEDIQREDLGGDEPAPF